MPTISFPNPLLPGTPARATEVMDIFNQIADVINGNLDSNNLAANAVTESKIAPGSVTLAKLGAGAVDSSKLANLSVTNDKVATNAAIAFSKMASLTASRALVTGSDGKVDVSPVTSVELGHLSGVQTNIQNTLQGLVNGQIDESDAVAYTFPQTPELALFGGTVNADGTADNMPTGWSINHYATGRYSISAEGFFDSGFTVIPVVSTSDAGVRLTVSVSGANFEVNSFVYNSAATYVDAAFSFLVLGLRN